MARIVILPYAVALKKENRYYWQWNIGKYIDQISRRFSKARVICHIETDEDQVFFRKGEPIYGYICQSKSLDVIPFPSDKPSYAIKLIAEQLSWGDFVYIFLPSYKGIIAAFVCQSIKKPYGIYLGSNWEEVAPFILSDMPKSLVPLLKRIITFLERLIIGKAAFTIAHGAAIIARYSGPLNRVYPAVPILNWELAEKNERIARHLGEEFRLLFIGTLNERKGLEYLINGFYIAHQHIPELRLTIVGAGQVKYEQKLQNMISQRKLDPFIHMVGYLSDPEEIRNLYQASDMFVLPTLGEGFPRVIYEAQSLGVPVITTRVGSLPLTLTHGENAYLVDPASPKSIAEAIEKLAESTEERQKLIRGGFEFSKQHLSCISPVEQFHSLYSGYVNGIGS